MYDDLDLDWSVLVLDELHAMAQNPRQDVKSLKEL